MEVMPLSVGTTSRAWDDQHLDLEGTAQQIDAADTTGFTAAVSADAARFCAHWTTMTTTVGTTCEGEADRLRSAIADYLDTDQESGVRGALLLSYLQELR